MTITHVRTTFVVTCTRDDGVTNTRTYSDITTTYRVAHSSSEKRTKERKKKKDRSKGRTRVRARRGNKTYWKGLEIFFSFFNAPFSAPLSPPPLSRRSCFSSRRRDRTTEANVVLRRKTRARCARVRVTNDKREKKITTLSREEKSFTLIFPSTIRLRKPHSLSLVNINRHRTSVCTAFCTVRETRRNTLLRTLCDVHRPPDVPPRTSHDPVRCNRARVRCSCVPRRWPKWCDARVGNSRLNSSRGMIESSTSSLLVVRGTFE